MAQLQPVPEDIETQFRGMNRAMALVLLDDCYEKAIEHSASFSTKLDLLKLNVKLGELEPKQVVMSAGAGIQFIINLPGTATSAPQTLTIDALPAVFDADPPARPAFLPALSCVSLPVLVE